MALLTLATIGLQLFAGYVNTRRQCKLSSDLNAAQQAFEEKATRQGFDNARYEFNRLCALQREIETKMQQDRMEQIKENFYSNLDLIAYSESLQNFPLLVPPFVMKEKSLSLLDGETLKSSKKVPVHCILTNCTDTQFNVKIFPELEERLGQYFCDYWNIGSDHPVIFYQGAWRDTTKDARPYISNLKSELSTLPVIVISPVITEDDGLQFLFTCWGFGRQQELDDNSTFTPNGLKFTYHPNHPYSDADKKIVIDELQPALAAFISYLADTYYWIYYDSSPLLPKLICEKKGFKILQAEYLQQYQDFIENSIEDEVTLASNPERLIDFIKSMPDVVDKDMLCLEIWRKRFFIRDMKNIDSMLDLNVYSYNDVIFLESIINVFPKYRHKIENLIGALQKQTGLAKHIDTKIKYNRISFTGTKRNTNIAKKINENRNSKYKL